MKNTTPPGRVASALPPLAFVAQHPAVIDADDCVHRWGCRQLEGLARIIRRGEVLWRVRAPGACSSCWPDVETRLSAPPADARLVTRT